MGQIKWRRLEKDRASNAAKRTECAKVFGGFAHRVFDGSKSCDKALGCIYIGSRKAALDSAKPVYIGVRKVTKTKENVGDNLRKYNITAIVNCTYDLPCEHSGAVEYCVVPVSDQVGVDILQYLSGAAAFINSHIRRRDNNQVGNVLVHCHMGISRSVTVVMAYLIQYQGMSCEEALATIKSQRKQARPNISFWEQLQGFERMVRENEGKAFIPLLDGSDFDYVK